MIIAIQSHLPDPRQDFERLIASLQTQGRWTALKGKPLSAKQPCWYLLHRVPRTAGSIQGEAEVSINQRGCHEIIRMAPAHRLSDSQCSQASARTLSSFRCRRLAHFAGEHGVTPAGATCHEFDVFNKLISTTVVYRIDI